MTTELPPKDPRRHLHAPRLNVAVSLMTILTAEKKHSGHCMIAEAIREQYPEMRAIAVDLQTIRLTDPTKKRRYIYLTPRIAQVALVRFDQGLHTRAFSFQLRAGQSLPSGRHATSEKAKTRTRMKTDGGRAPDVIGGQAPPRAALASGTHIRGARRAFGLRGLEVDLARQDDVTTYPTTLDDDAGTGNDH